MPGGFLSKERFDAMESTDLKLGVLFDTVVKLCEKTDALTRKVEKWTKIYTALAVIAGAVAGFFGGMFKG